MDISLPFLNHGRRLDIKYLARRSWFVIAVFEVVVLAMLLSSQVGGAVASVQLPELPEMQPLAEDSRILDVKGRQIALLHGEEHRIIVEREQISNAAIYTVLAAEDHRFFDHGGVNGTAMLRAALANVKEGEIEQGGSTITQQFVRNAFAEVGKERTMARKLNEAWLATRLEKQMAKDEILLGYMNTIYFGRGAYGIEAAAREYFGKPARHLDIPEAAFLAGIIKSPETLSDDLEAAKFRRDYVIGRLLDVGWTTPATAAAAIKTPLKVRPRSEPPVRAAHFVEYVRRTLITPADRGGFGLTDRDIYTGGLTIHTTLNLDTQSAAERAVMSVLPNASDPEAALVSMATSGEIRALVGGRNFNSIEKARGFNYATQIVPGAGRSAGSTFKPFTLLAYLRAGLSPRDSYRAPSKIKVPSCGSKRDPWEPGNYGNNSYGTMDVVKATELSVNTVYAQMVARVGPESAMKAAHDAGITSPLLGVCSIALGPFGVTPLEMARSYATFAGRGMRPDPIAVTKIVDRGGTVIAERKPTAKRTIEEKHADMMNAILEGVVRNGTGRPARISLTSAGKTGTTEKKRDAWYVGYTPAPGLVTAVWMGYPPGPDGKVPIMTRLHGRSVSGGGFPGRIWARFMGAALTGAADKGFEGVQLPPAKRTVERKQSPQTEAVAIVREAPSAVTAYAVDPSPAAPPPQQPKKKRRRKSPSPDPDPEPEPSPSGSTGSTGQPSSSSSEATPGKSPSDPTPASSPSSSNPGSSSPDPGTSRSPGAA
ncbi:MAG TPA: transglycosylase domain-containing protein [Actinomycetota bacterium]|nr:transglycosylase domain-containing protein [Actinomycetota bacterium]